MVTTIGMIFWILVVCSITGVGVLLGYKWYKTATKDFKYKIFGNAYEGSISISKEKL